MPDFLLFLVPEDLLKSLLRCSHLILSLMIRNLFLNLFFLVVVASRGGDTHIHTLGF
jgi:hypothetical protein